MDLEEWRVTQKLISMSKKGELLRPECEMSISPRNSNRGVVYATQGNVAVQYETSSLTAAWENSEIRQRDHLAFRILRRTNSFNPFTGRVCQHNISLVTVTTALSTQTSSPLSLGNADTKDTFTI